MSSGQPYHGLHRKLVIAFDVGTTFSGASYSILDPGEVPKIQGVTRYPAQQKVGGDSKIPTIIYYDQEGRVQAVGAEALQESLLEKAEDEEWIKVEWFKLHLRPKTLTSSHITDADIPPLPKNKTAVAVFADFLQYLYDCARAYIQDTHPNGLDFWTSVEKDVEFVLSLPNGWEGAQQAQMRKAAVLAGLVSDEDGQDRIQFVTEGEASLHFCIKQGLMIDTETRGDGVIIVDAGGGTVDLNAYCQTAPNSFEEVAPSECRLQGSVFVSRRARTYLEDKLQGSRYLDDVNHMTNVFDKTTKLTFRNSTDPAFIRFGSVRDKDPRVGIKSGQIKLPGTDVADLFEPSIQEIIDAIKQQRQAAKKPISTVFLVGGFAASDWLFMELQEFLQPLNIDFCRPDGHLNKAVADGAVSFYLDHFVSVRVARFTYGTECCTTYDRFDPEHRRRSHNVLPQPSGSILVPNCFSSILLKGTSVSEDKEFKEGYFEESLHSSSLESTSVDILSYKGFSANPKWIDTERNMFSSLCTVIADTTRVARSLSPRRGKNDQQYYQKEYSIVLLFGLTELKAQLSWMEDGVEMRSPAEVVYDQVVEQQRR